MYVSFDPGGPRGTLWFRALLTSDCSIEHLGDSVLGLVVTDLLRDTFPFLRVGPTTVFACALPSRHAHRRPGHRKFDRRSLGIPTWRPCKIVPHLLPARVPHLGPVCSRRSLRYRLHDKLRMHPSQVVVR